MANTLVTSQYVLPGSYLGRIYTPNAGTLSGDPRQPCFVGKGSRLAVASNIPIRRSFLEDVTIPFPPTVPHLVTLANPSDGDQTISTLTTQNGSIIPASKWTFQKSAPSIEGYDQILMLPEAFNITSTYTLDYQTIDRDVVDEVPFADTRQMVRVGDFQDQDLYQEQVDYYIITSKTDPVADTVTNDGVTLFTPVQQTAGVGAPTPVVNAGATYAGQINRHYRVECVGTVPLVLQIDITNEGGGSAVTPDYPTGPNISGVTLTVAVAGTFDLDTSVGLSTLGTLFDVDPLDAGVWTVGDVFEFNGLAAPLVELDPAYDNTNQYSTVAAVTADVGNGGVGSVTLNPNTDYDGETNRGYRLECAAMAGLAPNRTATFDWQGFGADGISKGTLLVDESVTGNLVNRTLEDGISVDFDFGSDITAANANFVEALGVVTLTSAVPSFTPGMVGRPITIVGATNPNNNGTFTIASYIDPSNVTYPNANPGATEVGAGLWTVEGFFEPTAATDHGDIFTTTATAPMLYYTGKDDREYTLTVSAAAATPFAAVTGVVFPGNSFDLATDLESAIALFPYIRVEGSTGNDGLYEVASTSYDSGTNTTTITTVEPTANAVADGNIWYGSGATSIFWSTATPEGGFGTIALMQNDTVSPLADAIKFYVRNSGNPLLRSDAQNNRNVLSDIWTFTVTNEDEISWDLVSRVTETVATTDLRQDTTGSITGASGGIPGTRYLILEDTPTTQPLRVWTTNPTTNATTELTVATTPPYVGGSDAYWITSTPYIFFPTTPTEPVSVTYEHRAAEPDPGQVYFITAYTLRQDTMFNNPIRLLNEDEAISVLGPMAPDNDVLIMALIALVDCDAFAVWITQAQDTDDDGVYTTFDYNAAIEATELNDQMTDITVLQNFDSLSKLKTSVVRMNDPFERKSRLAWIGAPIGTEIGDTDTPDTLVYLAKRTLQVYGESPAHGAFICVGNTVCERTIELAEGTQVTVTLDGSFVAGAASALVGSFTDPGETILRKDQPGFDRIGGTTIDIQYEEKEQKILGAAGISTVVDVGGEVYQWVEDITVDTFSQDTQQINAMTQKQYLERYIRSRMDTSITGIVAPSAQAGVAIVKGFLVELLRSLGSRGIVGPWTDDNGNERDIDPQNDVEVFRDETDRTLYHYRWWANLRYPIKRTFGLYSVDSRAWTPLAA